MNEALLESMNSIAVTSPNPAVGCVVVVGNEVVARGSTEKYGGRHAERVAFESLKDVSSLSEATVYVTLEPCSHQGKQPPCVELFLMHKIKRLVVGVQDKDELVNGQGIKALRDAGIDVTVGVLASEIKAWLLPFFVTRTNSERPFIALKWAQTLDGQLADAQNCSQWITGPKARAYGHWLRQKYDGVLVGAGTVLADVPKLDVRDCSFIKHQPLKIIFDPDGKVYNAANLERILKTTFQGPVLYLSEKDPPKTFARLPQLSFGKLKSRELAHLVEMCSEKSILFREGRVLESLFVEGGPQLLSLFWEAKCFDAAHIFIAPLTLGAAGRQLQRTNVALPNANRLKPISQFSLEDDLVWECVEKSIFQKIFS